jgi:uncharacterized membrane protein
MWKDFVLTGTILLVVDVLFLYSNRTMFKQQVENVQHSAFKMNYFGATFAYILLIFGLYWFIIKDNRCLVDAFILGFVIYGVYEGTSKALLKKWDYKTMVVDTLWGGTLMVLTTSIVYSLKNTHAFKVGLGV